MSHDDQNEIERVVLLQRLKPDATEDYITAHDNVPSSVVEAMNDGGVEEYELYVYDDIAISIIEVADFKEFEEVYSADPENKAWEERVSEYKESGIDSDNMEMPTMEKIWSLSGHQK